MDLLLAGGSGLIGNAVRTLAGLARHRITTVGRRPDSDIVSDFTTPLKLPFAPAAICALGTTIATAGSREGFRAVDYDAVVTFARSAREAGVQHFLIVSAVGANATSPVFYSRVKGQVELAIAGLGFSLIDIAQPGLLLGKRRESRPAEQFFQRLDPVLTRLMRGPLDRYSGISADTVAAALLALCMNSNRTGVFRHQNRRLCTLAAPDSHDEGS